MYTNFSFVIKVVTTLDGNFITQVGSTGEEGLNDGSFDIALFNRPQVHILDWSYFIILFLIFTYICLLMQFIIQKIVAICRVLHTIRRKMSFMSLTLKIML